MPVKTPKATKDLAYAKLRAGLSNKEVADLTGLSLRSIGRMKALQEGKVAMPPRKARAGQEVTPASQDVSQTGNEEDKPTIDFIDSPAPVEKKGVVDSAWTSLKGMLGISDEKKAAAPILSAKLDPKRQQFVDSVSPMLSLGFVAISVYIWRRIDSEVAGYLAPSEAVALKIVTPLVRIYARHANFLTDVNPDMMDVGAAAFALYGYVDSSIKLYRQIKEEQAQHENGQINGNIGGHGGWREYRPAPSENGFGDSGDRHTDVQRGSGGNGASNGSNGGYPGNVNIPNLSGQEQAQYAALSRLSQLDYQHRARRSGRP